ncbi:cystatin-like [Erythrolamprus reginae]|uniref:cystatin-like n=1 Tax=Erythrolamprus reginae TaxID=121349 RepID=UPI00396CB9A3
MAAGRGWSEKGRGLRAGGSGVALPPPIPAAAPATTPLGGDGCSCFALPVAPRTARPMVRSQIPAALGLLCALLALLPSGVPGMIPGGLSPRSVTDPEVRKAAAFAVEEYNARSSNANYFKNLRIVDAQSQVVAGEKYFLTMELAKTQCEKTHGKPKVYKEIQNCELPPRGQQEKLTCHFEVWSRPWLKQTELTRMACN